MKWSHLHEARKALTCAIALSKPNKDTLFSKDLDVLVCDILDAFVLALMCEARAIEPSGRLQGILKRTRPMEGVEQHMRRLGMRFQTSLWPHIPRRAHGHVPIGALCEVGDLLMAHSFERVDVKVPGHWYERMLAQPMRFEAERGVVFGSDGRADRGVYYTPEAVAKRLVAQVLEPLLHKRTPEEIQELAVLDPACGSGALLIEAWRHLSAYYTQWYASYRPSRWCKLGLIRRDEYGNMRLTTKARLELLSRHIFGVDLDIRALRHAQRALMLEAWTGVLDEHLNSDQLNRLVHDARMRFGPTLLYGDALTKPSRAGAHGGLGVDLECACGALFERARPGFDAIVGNPPYVLLESLQDDEDFAKYARSRYVSASYKIDTYMMFFERGMELLRPGGRLGFVTPGTYLSNTHAAPLRRLMLERTHVCLIETFEQPVFEDVSVDVIVTVLERPMRFDVDAGHQVKVRHVASPEDTDDLWRLQALQSWWAQNTDAVFDITQDETARHVLKRIDERASRLGDVAFAYFGAQTYDRSTYVVCAGDARLSDASNWRPCMDGAHIQRFVCAPKPKKEEWVCILAKALKSGGRADVHERERIVVRQIGKRPICAIAPAGVWALNTMYNVCLEREDERHDLRYVLATLCSALLGWCWERRFSDYKKTFPKIKKEALLNAPFYCINFECAFEVSMHDAIVARIDEIVALRTQAQNIQDVDERDAILLKTHVLEGEVDDIFFALYGLTAQERDVILSA